MTTGLSEIMNEYWRRAAAIASEGHCPECRSRLRTLTDEEQVKADKWWAEPFAVCTNCSGVLTRIRPGQPGYEEFRGQLTGISWTSDGRPPFDPPRSA